MKVYSYVLCVCSVLCLSNLWGQSPVDLLRDAKGRTITESSEWPELRAKHFETAIKFVYGTMPLRPERVTSKMLSRREIMEGMAVEDLLILNIHRGDQTVPIRVGVIRPNSTELCPVIIKNDRWLFDLSSMPPGRKRDQYASEKRDETFVEVVKLAISRGYAICKFVREDFAEDANHSRETGVLAMYPQYDWGAIAAWAWGYSPVIDYLLDSQNIDANRIIATGHSRGGKTALAAAVFDQRIAVAAPSASGSGGTGSMQHFSKGGRQQTSEEISANHGFWFSPRLAELESSQALPIDGHVLHSLVAPRGLINTQGLDDPLANPRGTRIMFQHSASVFQLLGAKTPPATHWRSGGHGQTLEDWQAILEYAEAYFREQPLPPRFNNWPQGAY